MLNFPLHKKEHPPYHNRTTPRPVPHHNPLIPKTTPNRHHLGSRSEKSRPMFLNYFKTAWRNIIRSKGYSVLNILGLATGMAVTLLIGLWVYDQYSYDRFLPGYEQVYRVKSNYDADKGFDTEKNTPTNIADVLRTEFPEVEYASEADWFSQHGLIVADKRQYSNGGQVQQDFLKIFPFPFLEGNANSALKNPYSIVLTESTAKALFGKEDPINK